MVLSEVLVGDVPLDDVLIPWHDEQLTVLAAAMPEHADVVGTLAIGDRLHEHDVAGTMRVVCIERGPVGAKPRQYRANPTVIDVRVCPLDHRVAPRCPCDVFMDLDLQIDAGVAQRLEAGGRGGGEHEGHGRRP